MVSTMAKHKPMLTFGTVPDLDMFSKYMDGAWEKQPLLAKVGYAVLDRDSFTCRHCGFKSSSASKQGIRHGWMYPVCLKHSGYLPVDANHSITLCAFCLSYQALNWATSTSFVGGQETVAPGFFIGLEQRSQAELNRLALYVVSVISSASIGSSKGGEEGAAMAIDNAMKARQSTLHDSMPLYMPGFDFSFARGLSLLHEELYSRRSEVIPSLRWWPNVQYWEKQGFFWRKASY